MLDETERLACSYYSCSHTTNNKVKKNNDAHAVIVSVMISF